MAHIAYAAWTQAEDDDEALAAHHRLQQVLKAHKALKPLQAQGLLSAAVAADVTTSVVNVVAQQGQTPGGTPEALVLGERRENP